ncbi:uncharacterized protein LOC131428854 [Malaya genurostris]|uniref:uncharacterized protein LOC131428854 n=1 Tax=Malaya genurostris TaxID=325434 RepID=UPI0026F3C9D0|nr:uncharacterized protein LOC131428854 [Malaya genurostris]
MPTPERVYDWTSFVERDSDSVGTPDCCQQQKTCTPIRVTVKMATDRRIKGLKLRQRSLLTSFNAITKFVDDYDEEHHADEIPVRLESIIKLWADLNTVQAELESLDEASLDEQLKLRMDYESAYYRSKGFLLAKNKINAQCVSSSASTSRVPPSASQVRLPDVKLPVFNGNLDNWLNFHDLFVSLVHSSVDLSNIQKFYYLRSSLSSDALKLIQTIPLSANNYAVAWNLLIEHYQNPTRLKQTYVDALFEFPSLRKESASDLHSLVEKFEANVKVLQQLGEKVQFWDILLIRMLSVRLDPTTRRDWEEFSSTKDAISFRDLTAFIQRRVTVLQSIQGTTVDVSISGQVKKHNQRPITSNNATQFNVRKCVVCNEHHPVYQCTLFSKMSLEDKDKEVRRHHLCRNCLRRGHQAKECSSTSTCRRCRGRHHTQLCTSSPVANSNMKPHNVKDEKSISTDNTSIQPSALVSASLVEPASFASASEGRKTILLATAVIIVVDDNGNEHMARALLDSGSECCFVTESFAQSIKVKRRKINLPIAGIGQSSTQARHKLLSTIRSRTGRYSTNLEFLVLPRITIDLPSTSVDVSSWEIPPSIQLADPSFYSTSSIDLILGAEIFFDLFKVSGRIPLGDNLPVLVNSVLGWVVSGRSTSCQSTTPIVSNLATVNDVHHLLEKFWSIEEDNVSPCHSVEEAACEEHFRRTVTRNSEGRYVVRLPLKQDVLATLVDNRRTALRRFYQLESRLHRNFDLHQQYRAFVEEYHSLGHMQRVDENDTTPPVCYHLPHHAVIREDSTTTKLRVVFDASCKTPNGPSLNDALMVGPTVQEDLRSIIMRSRTHPVMLIADIKQMYRQVLVGEQDTSLQRIVWRVSPDSPMETYELKTVTYGTASAPYLATRVLQQLADDEHNNYPKAAEVLRKDFYVDDLFSGGGNIEETIEIRKQLNELLSKGGFELRKWASNEPTVLEGIPPEDRALRETVDLDRDKCIKTLGLLWEPSTDQLRYRIQLPPSTDTILTKRIVLSYIARLFDPLGLVGPVVATAKVFMQKLWALKDKDNKAWDWDNDLPPAIKNRWYHYQSQLSLLNDLRIDSASTSAQPTSLTILDHRGQNTFTGVDYWGPIQLKPPHRRAAPTKAYVAVFVCFATKAVHLELAGDLSTAKFIEALRRFVSRRGLCSEIYSDNGRNFIGAANELRQLVKTKGHNQQIAQECADNGIQWHFNPPKASHFGGLWEAALSSAQKHFVRVLGTHTLAYDSMETLLTQIECCLNSRPIVPMSDDASDYEVLTPGHFLVGTALKAVPDNNVIDIPFNRLRQWQQTQKLYQQLWKRWHLEYLSTLQTRTKWYNPPVHLQENQLVIIKDENAPPMSWKTGRIIQLHPGDDGTTRVVTLLTPTGRYTRPVSKICLLPISSPLERNESLTCAKST